MLCHVYNYSLFTYFLVVTPVAELINDKDTETFTPRYYIAKHYFVKERKYMI